MAFVITNDVGALFEKDEDGFLLKRLNAMMGRVAGLQVMGEGSEGK